MRSLSKGNVDYLLNHLHQFVALLLSVALKDTVLEEPRLQFTIRPRIPNSIGRGVIVLLHLPN